MVSSYYGKLQRRTNSLWASFILVNIIIILIPDKQTKGSTTLAIVPHTTASLVASSRQLSTQAETTSERQGNSNKFDCR